MKPGQRVEMWGASIGPFLVNSDGKPIRKLSWDEFWELQESGEIALSGQKGDVLFYEQKDVVQP